MFFIHQFGHVGSFLPCVVFLVAAGVSYFLYLRQFARALRYLEGTYRQKANIYRFRHQLAFLRSPQNFGDRKLSRFKRKAIVSLMTSCVFMLLEACSLTAVLMGVLRR
ncbi:MAG TPA: hypothetical protein VMD52_06740 [Patescibacteria group bacterium]|nr:hypothetical protein [Patescibacteria group bacterium]